MPRTSRKKDLKPFKLCRPPLKSPKHRPNPNVLGTNESIHCIDIGSENKEKWLALKVKLNFSSDEDFASFLLDFYTKKTNSSLSKTSTENQGLQKPGESITVLKSSGQQITSDLIQENTSIPVEEENNSSVIVVNTTLRPAYEAEDFADSLVLEKETKSTATKQNQETSRNSNRLKYENTIESTPHREKRETSKDITDNTVNNLISVSKPTKAKQKNRKIKHKDRNRSSSGITDDTCFKQRKKKLKLLENSPPPPSVKPLEESATVASLKNEVSEIEVSTEVAGFRLHPPTEVVAVNIQLCDDCELHHDQDACPLQKPIAVVCDAISPSDWTGGGNAESELAKSFAEASLPACLELRVLDAKHGATAVARESVQAFTQFGPLIGHPLREMEIPDDSTMEHVWEVSDGSSCRYLTTSDPNTSNWLRFVRPAAVRSSRNLEVVSKGGQLMFVTTTSLSPGEELLFWAENRNPSWSHKRLCKTKCGGCNLSFSHTLYYRLHCAVFHDPAYSLTVRKYHCKVCGSSVLGKENIVKHAAEKHNGKGAYQCQYCRKFFLRLNYLEMHRTYGCAANPNRARPLCDYCGRKFCQPQKLKVHIKRMHSEMLEVLRDFQCKHCLKLLGSRVALQRHVKEVHRKDVVGAFTCDRCGKLFQNKSNLKIHMLTHSGVKPFKCKEPDCPAGFTTKQCLQSHYRKIHGMEDNCMPPIERTIEYTFDAYAGTRRPSSVNSDSQCSSDGEEASNEDQTSLSPPISVTGDQMSEPPPDSFNSNVISKASKKWMGEVPDTGKSNVFDFDEEDKDQDINVSQIDDEPIPMLFHNCKQDSTNASLLVEAALDAAEREIENAKLPSPLSLVSNKEPYPIRMPQSPLSLSRPMSPVEYPIQDQSQSPHLPMESCYSAPSLSPRHPYSLMFPERGSHYDFRLSPPPQMDNFPQEDLRYDIHHRREDSEDIVQNLSLGLKSKPVPLDIGYKYDPLDDRGFECSEGLDMSRTSYHHSFISMVPRYPHSLYEPRSYSHTDVLRVVNLSHSVDLSLPRSHHQMPAPVSQSMVEPIRILSPPPPYQSYPLATSPSPSPYNRPPLSPSYHHYNTSY